MSQYGGLKQTQAPLQKKGMNAWSREVEETNGRYFIENSQS